MSKFKNTKIGENISENGVNLVCLKTYTSHRCEMCHFKEKSKNCPQGKKYPLCFAVEREDRESVYFKRV